jgi:hypothetical protein
LIRGSIQELDKFTFFGAVPKYLYITPQTLSLDTGLVIKSVPPNALAMALSKTPLLPVKIARSVLAKAEVHLTSKVRNH